MTINTDKSTRRTITIPNDIDARLQQIAQELTSRQIGKVTITDLLVEAAKKVIADYDAGVDK